MVGADHRENVFPANHGNDFGFDSKSYGKGLEGFEQRMDVALLLKKDHTGFCVIKTIGSKGRQKLSKTVSQLSRSEMGGLDTRVVSVGDAHRTG